MFSGIIKDLGKLQKKEDCIFTFKAPYSLGLKLDQGVSIAINGVCLTVLGQTADSFAVEVMPETIRRTMLGTLLKNDVVNLELPVTPKDLLSGHLVQGHVDGVGKVISITEDENGKIVKLSYLNSLDKYIVEKGSIAINGISLTVISVSSGILTLGIIPYTFKHTMMHQLKKNDMVNIEVDILAKYVEKLCIK